MQYYTLIVDITLLALLLAVLFMGWRISRSLKIFAAAREDMQRLVMEVSGQISRAQEGVQNLKKTAQSVGRDLEKQIDVAKGLSDELQILNEAADSLATRLESSSGQVSLTKPDIKDTEHKHADVSWIKSTDQSKHETSDQKSEGVLFNIRDPEFEQNLKEDPSVDGWSGPEELETKAERELYNALKSKKVHN